MDNASVELAVRKEAVPKETDDTFEEIMARRVGNEGQFQTRYNLIFNSGMMIFASLIYYNIIMAMNTPDHWCHVPGRELTNLTIDQWRDTKLPRELDNHQELSYSHCHMFKNVTIINSTDVGVANELAACLHGYEYNRTWFRSTIITDNDWVCDRELYKYNSFVFDRFGEIFGSFVFGQLGDRFGRRIVLNLSLFAMLSGRIVQIYSTTTYWLFAAAAVWGSVLAGSAFQAVYVISMEIAKPENRAQVAISQALSRSLGMCIMPFIFWLVNDWSHFMWLSSLPIGIFFCFPKYMIESPRWLVSKGKWDLSAMYLNRIALINGKEANLTGDSLRSEMPTRSAAATYGIASLFSAARLARTTMLLVTCWICGSVGYFILILLISQLPGNPFWNFFGHSFVELPSYFIGGYLCNTFGRRFTNVGVFLLSAFLSVLASFSALYYEWETFSTGLSIGIKFCVSIALFTVNLQMAETYPTCLRQTGLSLGMVVSNCLGVVAPYAVLWGNIDSRYPFYLLATMFIVGSGCAAFLPETLHQNLPDSVEEAIAFGEDQVFWSLPRKPKTRRDSSNAELKPLSRIPA